MTASDESVPFTPRRRGPLGWVLFLLFGFLLPLVVLAVGVWQGRALLESGPEAKRRSPTRVARLVEVEPVRVGPHRTEVTAMGTVLPSRSLELHSRVSGEVADLGPGLLPGGRLATGDLVVRLDPTDFDLAVAQRRTDVARAESDLAIELGQQAVSRREFELLGETVSDEERALVLREPQLATVKARLEAARSLLRQAELDRARTEVTARFPALVRRRHVEVGSQVGPSTALAEVVGTKEFWVEAQVPVDRLRWIRIPRDAGEPGATVRIHDEAAWGEGVSRTGLVFRLLGDLDPQGRTARLLVSVSDPLALEKENEGKPRLLLGSYVRVVIDGTELPSVAVISRERIRDGNHVWIYSPEHRLEIRPVEIVLGMERSVCVTDGLVAGELMVVTDLSAPVPGMLLRTAETRDDESADAVTRVGEEEAR